MVFDHLAERRAAQPEDSWFPPFFGSEISETTPEKMFTR